MTRNGALAGMVTGAITVIIWKQGSLFGLLGWEKTGLLALYEIIPGFILASLAIVLVSYLGAVPSSQAVARFEAARQEYSAD